MVKLSVLMPVYNSEMYLREAIESILNQTFSDFEFLIVDDGSNDSSLSIIQSYKDSRIKIYTNPENIGLIKTLNNALLIAKGEYVARMDSDDIAAMNRLEKQVAFLDANNSVGLVSSHIKIPNRSNLYKTTNLNSDEIKNRLLFENIIAHPTVMYRSELIKKHQLYYNEKYIHAEDYELWLRFSLYTDIAIIPEVLVKYRIHKEQVSIKYNTIQRNNTLIALEEHLKKIGLILDKNNFELLAKIFYQEYNYNPLFLTHIENWLIKLKSTTLKNDYKNDYKEKILSWVWFEICTEFESKGVKTTDIFKKSILFNKNNYSSFFYFKYVLKSYKNSIFQKK